MKPLGEVCDIQNGFAFKSKDYTESGARVIRIGNVQKGLIGDKSPRFMDLERLSDFSRFQIYENDILISLTGDVGRVGRFPEHLLPALLNQRVGRFQNIDSSSMISEFLFHVLNSDWFEKLVIESSEGAAQMNSSTKKIKAIPIPIPPRDEQERIVKVLDEAFAAIDKAKANIERNLTNARELFQSRLNDIFSNPSEDWVQSRFSEEFKLKSGDGLTKKKMNLDGGIPVYGGNGQTGTHDASNSADEEFLIIGRVGAHCGNVHLVHSPCWVTDNAFRVMPSKRWDLRFLSFFPVSLELRLILPPGGTARNIQ